MHDSLQYFLTYADNNAVGYFSKQGFTTGITMPKDQVSPLSHQMSGKMHVHMQDGVEIKVKPMAASSQMEDRMGFDSCKSVAFASAWPLNSHL